MVGSVRWVLEQVVILGEHNHVVDGRHGVSADLGEVRNVRRDHVLGNLEEVVLHVVGERRRVQDRAVWLSKRDG